MLIMMLGEVLDRDLERLGIRAAGGCRRVGGGRDPDEDDADVEDGEDESDLERRFDFVRGIGVVVDFVPLPLMGPETSLEGLTSQRTSFAQSSSVYVYACFWRGVEPCPVSELNGLVTPVERDESDEKREWPSSEVVPMVDDDSEEVDLAAGEGVLVDRAAWGVESGFKLRMERCLAVDTDRVDTIDIRGEVLGV